ncbi:MAG: GNAT family N-acetyltransferase [Novosphingobium sp.]
MNRPCLVAPITAIGPELRALVAVAGAEGFGFMDRLVAAWDDGTNRFDRPGEVYLGAMSGSSLVAAGGLNRDPYCADPRIGRVRHLYVHPDARRSGAGRALMTEIVARSRESFDLLRLRTTSERGAAFYEALGFMRSGEPDASHLLKLV